MNETLRPLLLSLKPKYAGLIFEGTKKIELRRRVASSMENRNAFVYVSSPVMQLQGGFQVGQVWKGTPEEVWYWASELAQVTKQSFDTYFEGRDIAYALEITDVWEFESPTHLSWLRSQFPNFAAPQSWRLVSPEEHQSFLAMKRKEKRPEIQSREFVFPAKTTLQFPL